METQQDVAKDALDKVVAADDDVETLRAELAKSDKAYKRLVQDKARFDAIVDQQVRMLDELLDRHSDLEMRFCHE